MKGILFKPDMIKAIIEGRKTVTRRVIKPQPLNSYLPDSDLMKMLAKPLKKTAKIKDKDDPNFTHIISAPRYQVGETVYIKEAWACDKEYDEFSPNEIPEVGRKVNLCYKDKHPPFNMTGMGRWRSPLHMPKWAARYFIQITDVRPERLQEITEEEAIKEGFKSLADFIEKWNKINYRLPTYERKTRKIICYHSYPYSGEAITETYRNKPHYIIPNPYVFRYEFKL